MASTRVRRRGSRLGHGRVAAAAVLVVLVRRKSELREGWQWLWQYLLLLIAEWQ